MTYVPWAVAMARANHTFYAHHSPEKHFRTSMVAAPVMAQALLRVVRQTDLALGHPEVLDLVDIGAATGDLLNALMQEADRTDAELGRRLRPHGVDLRARPSALDHRATWTQGSAPAALPDTITGVVLAHEWLDDVPIDVYTLTSDGSWLGLEVDPSTGQERTCDVADDAGVAWLQRRVPAAAGTSVGARFEAGHHRDACWSAVSERVERGLMVAIDYGTAATQSSPPGTLVGFVDGRPVAPIPDGSMNITADVALDSCARAVEGSLARRGVQSSSGIVRQREAIDALVPLREPATNRWADLARATHRAELTDLNGLGAHLWLGQAVGIALPPPWA